MAFMTGHDEQDEKRLVSECLAGNQTAWEKLVSAQYRVITSVVRNRKWGFDRREQEDVVQDVLRELVTSLDGHDFQSSLGAFIRTIAMRQCTALLRHKKAIKRTTDRDCLPIYPVGGDHEDAVVHHPVGGDPDPETALLVREDLGMLKRALAALDVQCKKLIRMRFFEDLSFPEMADALDLKCNTVAVQVGRCVKKLRPFFG
jgi:RNA polymerase sigma factor (sigma-70 family)